MASRRLQEVAPGVLMATSRRYATTSTVLVDGHGGAVVIDPNWDPDELAAIPADLADLGLVCVAGLATHVHCDHVLWHSDLGDPPRWASARTVDDLARDRERLLAPLAEFLTPDLINLAGRLRPLPDDGLPWSGPRTRGFPNLSARGEKLSPTSSTPTTFVAPTPRSSPRTPRRG